MRVHTGLGYRQVEWSLPDVKQTATGKRGAFVRSWGTRGEDGEVGTLELSGWNNSDNDRTPVQLGEQVPIARLSTHLSS